MRKDEEIVRLAGKVVDELRWKSAPEERIDQFVRILKQYKNLIELKVEGRSAIPQLEDALVELRIKE